MATLTIRNLEASVKERLRVRAAQNRRSMEAEVRAIVTEGVEALARPLEANLYDRIRAHVEPTGGVELELPPRRSFREPPTFE
jgi:plasmid stability protein